MKKRNRKDLDIRSALLLLAAIFILALRLAATDWVDSLDLFSYLTFIAAIAGIALGISRFPFWLVSLFSLAYGAFTIPWLYGISLDQTIPWYDRLVNIMLFRLKLAYSQYAANLMVSDPILFLTILAILFWVISFVSGYILSRYKKVWLAILPPGLALLTISHYDRSNPSTAVHILLFLFFTLILFGRSVLIHNQISWMRHKIVLNPRASLHLRRAVMIFTILVLAIAWLIPINYSQKQRYSEVWTNLTKPWEKFQTRISNMLDPLGNATVVGEDGGFDASLSLGTSTSLGGSPLFTVTPDIFLPSGLNNYWKVRSYNIYLNDQWFTSNDYARVTLFPQNFRITIPDWLKRETFTYSFFMKTSQAGNFYTINTPTWVSRQIQILYHELPDGEQDVIAAFGEPSLQPGETYQISAQIGNPTRSELRESGDVYPDWLDRYLQLPVDLSPSITALSEEITSKWENPFDKAQAITQYLRSNITYSPSVGNLPPGADPVEWFLFESKTGYCNYYATAEVLLLRAAGVPARISVGYAQGSLNPETGAYTVTQRDKHAWPEVYFNNYGWIEFEPTGSQPVITRPIGLTQTERNSLPDELPIMDEEEPIIETPEPIVISAEVIFIPVVEPERSGLLWLIWITILGLSGCFALLIWWLATPQVQRIPLMVLLYNFLQKHNWKRPQWLQKANNRKSRKPISKAYAALTHSAKILGNPLDPSKTPAEQGAHLANLAPEMTTEIDALVNEYELAEFSIHKADMVKANEASLRILKTSQYKKFIGFFKRK
ncbi:MAG: transglutaminase-like domain-containing protein [Anaerolineaceae bacterium]|nr:transglutaminase-like domain-containing protein [Anaerolineaceae bacterium]